MLLQSLQHKLDMRTAKAQLDISKQGTEGALRSCPGDARKQLPGCHRQFQGGSNFQERTQMHHTMPDTARLQHSPYPRTQRLHLQLGSDASAFCIFTQRMTALPGLFSRWNACGLCRVVAGWLPANTHRAGHR